jgi:hypothetical protein
MPSADASWLHINTCTYTSDQVSVIVCTLDTLLARCPHTWLANSLLGVLAVTIPEHKDRVLPAVANASLSAADFAKVTVLESVTKGKRAQLSLGIRHTKDTLLATPDDHISSDPNFLNGMLPCFDDETVAPRDRPSSPLFQRTGKAETLSPRGKLQPCASPGIAALSSKPCIRWHGCARSSPTRQGLSGHIFYKTLSSSRATPTTTGGGRSWMSARPLSSRAGCNRTAGRLPSRRCPRRKCGIQRRSRLIFPRRCFVVSVVLSSRIPDYTLCLRWHRYTTVFLWFERRGDSCRASC